MSLDRRIVASWAKRAAVAAIALFLAWGIWTLANNKSGVKRDAPRVVTMVALPPPPPPPPKPLEPPKEVVKEEVQTPDDSPKPVEAPTPVPDAPQAVTIAGDAQAGSDAFGIQAGSGGGMAGAGAGRGLGNATYDRYLGYVLQQAIQKDDRVNRLVFNLQVQIWIDAGGRIEKVELARSSGDDRTDGAVVAALNEIGRIDEPPPPGARFPQRLTIRGQKQG